MKRVLLVSPFPPTIGGVSISVQRLYEYLKYSGYNVERYNTQIDNRKYNYKLFKFIKYLLLPLYLLKERRYDIIHLHVSNIIPKLYVAIWRPLFPNSRFVITMHGQIKDFFQKKAAYFAVSRFDRIILVTKGDKMMMPVDLRYKTAEIPAFIPPVINDNIPDRSPVELNEFLKRDSFKILLNGSIIINENFYDLYGFKDAIVLLENLRSKNRKADLILVLIGSNYSKTSRAYISDLKEYVHKKNLDEHVFWVEGITIDLWPLLKKIDLLLRPTKSDGDALSIRESLYLRIPVISSNVVPRPKGTLVYSLNSDKDLLDKTIFLMEHYNDQVAEIGKCGADVNFAEKIIEQYGI